MSSTGLTAPQLAALGRELRLAERSTLVVQLRGELDGGTVRVTWRDRWAVEHVRIDTHGDVTRPVAAGLALAGEAQV